MTIGSLVGQDSLRRRRRDGHSHRVERSGELAIDGAGNLYFADSEAYQEDGVSTPNERILTVFGVAAPGLIAGLPFPKP